MMMVMVKIKGDIMTTTKDMETFNFLIGLSNLTLAKIYRAIELDHARIFESYDYGLLSEKELLRARGKMRATWINIGNIITARFHNGAYYS
jgi:hypothetical protein